mmetsp:Transcript_74019/g.208947  ORF Transcript_74019/g.208947 Transcript_74019/m.208947 type:complete len:251 (-) Transcript_74019:159-911(-)
MLWSRGGWAAACAGRRSGRGSGFSRGARRAPASGRSALRGTSAGSRAPARRAAAGSPRGRARSLPASPRACAASAWRSPGRELPPRPRGPGAPRPAGNSGPPTGTSLQPRPFPPPRRTWTTLDEHAAPPRPSRCGRRRGAPKRARARRHPRAWRSPPRARRPSTARSPGGGGRGVPGAHAPRLRRSCRRSAGTLGARRLAGESARGHTPPPAPSRPRCPRPSRGPERRDRTAPPLGCQTEPRPASRARGG